MPHLWIENRSPETGEPEWVVRPLDGEAAVPLGGASAGCDGGAALLLRSQTDLGCLVAHVLYRQPPEVNLPRATVGRWERHEPETWAKVRDRPLQIVPSCSSSTMTPQFATPFISPWTGNMR